MNLKACTPKFSAALALPLSALLLTGCIASTPLDKAASAGDTQAVKTLLDGGANANKGHALYAAVKGGHIETLKLLLSRGANPNAPSGVIICPAAPQSALGSLFMREQDVPQQAPVLVMAAGSGNIEAMKALLDAGADINGKVVKTMQFPCNNYTALLLATRTGNAEAVQFLLDRGANRELRGGRLGGHTALEWAQKRQGLEEIAAMLHAAGTETPEQRQTRVEERKKKQAAEAKAAMEAVTGPEPAAQPKPEAPAAPKPAPKRIVVDDSQL